MTDPPLPTTPVPPAIAPLASGKLYDYLSAVVHDLRNPLGAAIGNLSFVRDSLTHQQTDLCEAIDDAGDAVRRVEALIDELVSVAQYESGTLRVRRESVDLGPLIEAAAAAAQREAGLRSVALGSKIDAAIHVDADRGLVRRVVESLIWCGFRGTPARGAIELRSERGPEGKGALVVACTGSIDPAGDSAPAVYFARAIALAHGGTLTVTSAPPFHTVIRLTFAK